MSARGRTPTGRQTAAYHEAGHAVAVQVQGLPGSFVSIHRGHGFDGMTDILVQGPVENMTPLIRQLLREGVEKHIRCLLAGCIAEHKFRPRSHGGGRHDNRDIAGLLEELCPDAREVKAYRALLRVQTENLIKRNWEKVETVAAALYQREPLSWNEIRAACGEQVSTSIFKNVRPKDE